MFNSSKTVPDWSGWLSKTTEGRNTVTESRIGYMQPIMHPIMDIATVKQCLQTSMDVTKMLQQEYTLVTMDMAAAKLAYNIIWGDRESYKNVIVNLGPFHTMCSYMGATGKMMSGSGFEDIVVEAQLCASGSIDQVMSGKHYNRSVHVHQRMLDALEWACFREHVNLEHGMESAVVVSNLASQLSAENLQKAQQNEDCEIFMKEYEQFKAAVREGKYGTTAQFWLQYCDSVWTLLLFQETVKENDLDLFMNSLQKMCGLLFSADHQHYGRDCWLQLQCGSVLEMVFDTTQARNIC